MFNNSQKSFPVISVLFLILVNLIPIYGVLFQGWQLFSILFIYWLESFIIGFFNVLKLRLARGTGKVNPNGEPVTNVADNDLIPFFLLHYGLFMIVHLIFVFVMFWPPTLKLGDGLLVFVSLFISHGISYFTNFLGRREYLQVSPEQQMFAPYARIMVMHMTILFGGAFAKAFGAPPIALIIMVLLKIVIDIYMHLNEHGFLPDRMRFKLRTKTE